MNRRGRPLDSYGPDGYVLIMAALEDGPLNSFQLTEKTGIKIKSTPGMLKILMAIDAIQRYKGDDNLYYYKKLVPTITRAVAGTMFRNNESFNLRQDEHYHPNAVRISFSKDPVLQAKHRETEKMYRIDTRNLGVSRSAICDVDWS